MPTDQAAASPLDWLLSLAGATIILLAALWRVRRIRSVPARVVNADPDAEGAVEVQLEAPGQIRSGGTLLRARRRFELGAPLALAAGDQVRVRPPRPDRRHVHFVLTPMSVLPGVLVPYGLTLIWVDTQRPSDASNVWPVIAVFATLGVAPFLTAGWFAGRWWFWLTARRVRGTVVDSRFHLQDRTPGLKNQTMKQALVSYEIDGQTRQRWSRGVYLRTLRPGRTVRVRVDRRNPGNAVTFGGSGPIVAVIPATFGFFFGGLMLWAFLLFLYD